MSTTIRAATPADLDLLVAMWTGLMNAGREGDGRYVPVRGAEERFRGHIRDVWLRVRKPFPMAWIAEVEGQPAGFLVGTLKQPHMIVDSPPTAAIHDMWVEPGCRRRGVGTDLARHFLATARAHGARSFEVGTLALDDRAVGFWKALGFTDWFVRLRLDDPEGGGARSGG